LTLAAAKSCPFEDLLNEIIILIADDAEALSSVAEIETASEMMASQSSAGRQRQAYTIARENGGDHTDALRAVVSHLIEEYHADL